MRNAPPRHLCKRFYCTQLVDLFIIKCLCTNSAWKRLVDELGYGTAHRRLIASTYSTPLSLQDLPPVVGRVVSWRDGCYGNYSRAGFEALHRGISEE